MTDREAFEAWAKEKGIPFHSVDRNPEYSVVAWMAWQAATAAERERCAKVCEEEAASISREGKGCYTGQYEYMSDGAERCADAIRKGK